MMTKKELVTLEALSADLEKAWDLLVPYTEMISGENSPLFRVSMRHVEELAAVLFEYSSNVAAICNLEKEEA